MKMNKKSEITSRKATFGTFFMRKKKGIAEVVAITLFLLITVGAGTTAYMWLKNVETDFQTKSESTLSSFKLVGLKQYDSDEAHLGLSVNGPFYFVIDTIKIDGTTCPMLYSNVVDGKSASLIRLNCTVNTGNSYVVTVFTPSGVLEERLVVR